MNRILSNGLAMPPVVMGTYPLKGEAITQAVVAAAQCGYRAFDTAHAYENEDSLGAALQETYHVTGLSRTDMFITSKVGDDLDNGRPSRKLFYASCPGERRDIRGIVSGQLDDTLEKLQTDYLDLWLVHWPHPDYLVEVWQAMEEECRNGRVRALGVSNCRERHLARILAACSVRPMVNQFEIHPLNNEKGLVAHCQRLGIQPEAYCPLMPLRTEAGKKMAEDGALKSLSRKYGKSVPQIILRWNVQNGVIPIPKSGNPERLRENIDIFDFELTDAEMQGIDALNTNHKLLVEATFCPGY